MASFLLVHSPLLGPSSWSRFGNAAIGRGFSVVVPDLTAVAALDRGWVEAFVAGAVASAERGEGPVTVVGHSGAGAFLPLIGHSIDDLRALVFVDAVVPPTSGTYRTGDAMAQRLDAVTVDGTLLPWLEWWPPEVIERILPDPADRSAIATDIPRVPRAFYEEPVPVPDDWAEGPCAYLMLSEAYRREYDVAGERRWHRSALDGGHLDIYTDPVAVLDAVVAALDAVAASSWMAETAICIHCGTPNLVAVCDTCGRPFVVTAAALEGRIRAFDEPGVVDIPPGYVPICDLDRARELGEDAASQVNQGLRQKICVECKTAFL